MLHPQSVAAVATTASTPKVTDPDFDVAAARRSDQAAARSQAREPVDHVVDLVVDGVPVRYYRPVAEPEGLVVHLHGGGFVFNDIEVHDASVRRLANRSQLAVLSVEYRRPPEHRFPAAPDDVSTVVGWLDRDGLATLGLPKTTPLFSHGDSAGGNLALVAALRHPGRFQALVLIYPFLDPSMSGASYAQESAGFDAAEAAWYWSQYVRSASDLHDPDLAPLLSTELGSLPPMLVVTAEHDPVRDDGELLATLVAQAGVEVVATRYLGLVHAFWRHPQAFDAAEPLMRQVAGFLRQHV